MCDLLRVFRAPRIHIDEKQMLKITYFCDFKLFSFACVRAISKLLNIFLPSSGRSFRTHVFPFHEFVFVERGMRKRKKSISISFSQTKPEPLNHTTISFSRAKAKRWKKTAKKTYPKCYTFSPSLLTDLSSGRGRCRREKESRWCAHFTAFKSLFFTKS